MYSQRFLLARQCLSPNFWTITTKDQTSYSHPGGGALYKLERLPRNRQIALSANVTTFFAVERNVISNFTTGPKLISILDVFHDASNQGKEFFS